MTRASEVAARAARLAARPASRTATEAARPTLVPRAKPVRLSVDLAPQQYRHLRLVCEHLAEDLGRSRVTHVEVMRAMVVLLGADPAVRDAVADTIRADT